MQLEHLPTRAAGGAAAGILATGVLQQFNRMATKRAPETAAPMRENPGEFMVEQAESRLPDEMAASVPEPVGNLATMSLHFAYGMTLGGLYAALRRRPGHVPIDAYWVR